MRAEAWSYYKKNKCNIRPTGLWGEIQYKSLSKCVQDNLKDSVTVNLTETRLLQQVQKIELINWDWLTDLEFINSYGNILPRSYLYIFAFQLVLFHGVSSLCFSWGTNFVGKIYRGIVLHGGNYWSYTKAKRSFTKCIFQ